MALLVVGGSIAAAVTLTRAIDSSDGTGTESPALALLLEDNTLVLLDRRGRRVRRVNLGHPPKRPLGASYIASTAEGRRLILVVPGDPRDELVLAPVEGRVSKRIALPHGVDFRAIEVGEATGRIYLAGEAATSQRTKEGGPARSAIAVVLSPEGNVVARRTLRRPGAEGRLGPLDWQVHDIAVSPDEQNVFVSYHGFNTEGADRVAVSGDGLRRCRSRPNVACIARVHGAIDVDAKGLIATTGTPPLLGLFSEEGRPLRSWQSGVARAHLMEFARAGARVLTVESCAKTGGMTVVDLRAGTARVLHEPVPAAPLRGLPARAICGERISTASGSLIAVMKRGTITGIGGVTLLAADGDVVEWVPLRPAPVDVHVLPRS